MTFKWATALFFIIATSFTIGCAVNPLTGKEELNFYPLEDDFKLGSQVAPQLEHYLGGRIDIPELQTYIDRIGQRIARVSHHPEWDYHFIAVDHEMINAMALPGGYIFITRGLLEKLTNEAQLASILGHEITHVIARDTMNAMSKQQSMTALAVLAAVADQSVEAAYAGMLTAQILSLSYSRDDENQADVGGLTYMVRCGYNPEGMIQTMEILKAEQEVRPIEFFSTHPLPSTRLAALHQRIKRKYPDTEGLKIGQEDYEQNVLKPLDAHPRPKGRRTPKRPDTVMDRG